MDRPVSKQLQRYRNLTIEQLDHRKEVAAIWLSKQDKQRLDARYKDWLDRRLAADPDYLKNLRARRRKSKKNTEEQYDADDGEANLVCTGETDGSGEVPGAPAEDEGSQ